MRILHILDHSLPLHSGYSFRTRAILREQRALGWQTWQLTSAKQGETDFAVEKAGGFEWHRCAPAGGRFAQWPVLDQIAVVRGIQSRLETLIPEIRPDILHAHSPALTGVAGVLAARRFNLPLVYECRAFWEDAAVDHGSTREGSLRYRASRALETWVLRRASAITTICAGIRDELATRGIEGEKITVIPNGVDPEQFAEPAAGTAALAKELGLDGATVLGFIGSFYAYEGLDLLLDAFPAILAARPDARLLLVGGGFQEAALATQARALGIEKHVVFTGRVPHERVAEYYDLIDLLIYPRHRMRLTELVTPLKPLEAMARQRLLLASNVGGHRELIEDGVTGSLFAAGVASALATSALDLLATPECWAARRAAGLRFVHEARNWRASVARYTPVYAGLAEQRGGVAPCES